ncbi:MAG: hypothetical protein GC185_08610 [Alphaproteobacteria bacterium]|nr:hypothetical protein [Alphaproteobacteria bacterium]
MTMEGIWRGCSAGEQPIDYSLIDNVLEMTDELVATSRKGGALTKDFNIRVWIGRRENFERVTTPEAYSAREGELGATLVEGETITREMIEKTLKNFDTPETRARILRATVLQQDIRPMKKITIRRPGPG